MDQLCVNQTDSSDIERHLQCMQRVYAESSYTLAPLSCSLGDPYLNRSLQFFLQEPSSQYLSWSTIKGTLATLEHIVQDRWFRRTWTYHERFCGTNVYLAIRAGIPASDAQASSDIVVSLKSIRSAFKHLANTLMTTQLSPSDNHTIPIMACLERIVRINFDYPRTSESPEHFDMSLNNQVFEIVETYDNAVVADRLAILSNIGKHIYPSQSTLLDDHCFSYSTYLLVLLFSNGWSELRSSSSRKHFFLNMNATVCDIIGELTTLELTGIDATVRHLHDRPCSTSKVSASLMASSRSTKITRASPSWPSRNLKI
jgi:hypothetical protein